MDYKDRIAQSLEDANSLNRDKALATGVISDKYTVTNSAYNTREIYKKDVIDMVESSRNQFSK